MITVEKARLNSTPRSGRRPTLGRREFRGQAKPFYPAAVRSNRCLLDSV